MRNNLTLLYHPWQLEDICLDEIFRLAKYLKPIERRIVKLRIGKGTYHSHTLEEIAKMFGVTRERIRQIEAKAFRKIQLYKFYYKS